jgi:hypothetical protein
VCSVIRLAGEADMTATALRDALAAAVAKRPHMILVDLTDSPHAHGRPDA